MFKERAEKSAATKRLTAQRAREEEERVRKANACPRAAKAAETKKARQLARKEEIKNRVSEIKDDDAVSKLVIDPKDVGSLEVSKS